jgi:Flp pilus assembly pilin Flp
MIRQFFHEEDGQALVEYGLILALIALIAISAITLFGKGIKNSLYDKATTQLPN